MTGLVPADRAVGAAGADRARGRRRGGRAGCSAGSSASAPCSTRSRSGRWCRRCCRGAVGLDVDASGPGARSGPRDLRAATDDRSALGGDQHRRVGGDHHLDGGEPLVGEPLLAQHVDPALVDRRPRRAGREVVEDHDAAGLDEVDDRVGAAVLGLAGVEEQQRERALVAAASTSRRRAPRPGRRRRRSPRPRSASLGSSSAVRMCASSRIAAAQPGGADPAAGAELRQRAGAGGGQRRPAAGRSRCGRTTRSRCGARRRRRARRRRAAREGRSCGESVRPWPVVRPARPRLTCWKGARKPAAARRPRR